MTEFESRIYEIVRQIPCGKVATYGMIAKLAGSRNFARAVGNAMHKNPRPFRELARKAGFTDGSPAECCQIVRPGCQVGEELCREVGERSLEPHYPEEPEYGPELPGGGEVFPPVPCHRVVGSSGRMGANFGLGGPDVQAAMLRLEGVAVCEDGLAVKDSAFFWSGELPVS